MNELITSDNNYHNKVYMVRGVAVMLDSDLAKIYQCANGTKTINQAVKRNIERFPSDFCFQLTKEEYDNLKFQFETIKFNGENDILRSQIGTLEIDDNLKSQSGTSKSDSNLRFQNETLKLKQGQYSKYLPYVFTELGALQLSSILRTKVATEVSIYVLRAFEYMKEVLKPQALLPNTIISINNRLERHEEELITHKDLIDELFDKVEIKVKKEYIFFDGQPFEAISKITDIFNEAKNKLIIIDSYADNNLLEIIKRLNVEVILITTNKCLTQQMIDNYNKQYNNLKVVYDNTYHDRFFIIDDDVIYHCGTSVNRLGSKTFAINLLFDDEIKGLMIDRVCKVINKQFNI